MDWQIRLATVFFDEGCVSSLVVLMFVSGCNLCCQSEEMRVMRA